jgi:hypothetical protein
MEDNYFQELFNEDKEPFPNFLSKLDSHASVIFQKLDFQPEFDPSIDKLDLESFMSSPVPFIHDNNAAKLLKASDVYEGMMEERKEVDSAGSKESDHLDKFPRIANKHKESIEELSKKESRAARNKRYAKESRQRKKMYVEGIEHEIVYLRQEVAFYKERLKIYEPIEKFGHTIANQLYEDLNKVQKKTQEFHHNHTDRELFSKEIAESFKKKMNEQRDALKAVMKILVDISLPLPIRVGIWLANNDIKRKEAKEIVEIMKPAITLEQAQAIIDYDKKLDPYGVKMKKFNELMKNCSKNVKDSLKEMIEHQRNILQQFNELADHLNATKCIYYNAYTFELHAKMKAQAATRPEIREYGVKELLAKLSLT